MPDSPPQNYRGRLAPSPTGLLHVGHARAFWIAAQRARNHHGTLILRNEDLDPQRSRTEFVQAMIEDLHWLGLHWTEGPDCGGPNGPYAQSERRAHYLAAWRRLRDTGFIYPAYAPARTSRKPPRRPTTPTMSPSIPAAAATATTPLNSPSPPE